MRDDLRPLVFRIVDATTHVASLFKGVYSASPTLKQRGSARARPGRWPSRLVEGGPAQPRATGGTFVRALGGHSCQGAVVVHPVLPTSACDTPPIDSPNDMTVEFFSLAVLVGNSPAGKYRVLRGARSDTRQALLFTRR